MSQSRFPTLVTLNIEFGPLNNQEAIVLRSLLELEPRSGDGSAFGVAVRPPRETMRVERGPEGLALCKGNRMLLFVHRSLVEFLYSPGESDDD